MVLLSALRVTFSAALLCLCPALLHAGLLVHGNWDIHNQTGQNVNDFHIEVTGNSGTFQGQMNGAFPNFVEDTPLGFPGHTYTWSGFTLGPGAFTHVGLNFEQEAANDLIISAAYWTRDGVPVGGNVGLPGFEFIPVGGAGPGRARLWNSTSDTFFLGGLSWSIVNTEIPLPGLVYNPAGLGNNVAESSIAPGSFVDIGTGAIIEPGQWFVLQGQVFADEARTVQLSSFINEHEHGTPEPSTVASMLTGLAGIALVFRRSASRKPE